jgi:hypothetical protein
VQARDPLIPVKQTITRKPRIEVPPEVANDHDLDGERDQHDTKSGNAEQFAFGITHG